MLGNSSLRHSLFGYASVLQNPGSAIGDHVQLAGIGCGEGCVRVVILK